MVLRTLLIIGFIAAIVLPEAITRADANPRRMLDRNVYKVTNAEQKGWGTAFPVEYLGHKYIVSNRHVCVMLKKSKREVVLVQPHNKAVYKTKILAMSNRTDLCALEYPKMLEGFFRLGSKERDEAVYTAGYPAMGGIRQLVGWNTTKYVIPVPLDYRKNIDETHCIEPQGNLLEIIYLMTVCMVPVRVDEYDFLVLPGHSGSPVIDKNGYVTGVIFAYWPKTNMSLAVPVSELARFLRKLIGGRAGHGY